MTFSKVDTAAPHPCCNRPRAWETFARRACKYSAWNSGDLLIRQAVTDEIPIEAAAFSQLGCCSRAKINCSRWRLFFEFLSFRGWSMAMIGSAVRFFGLRAMLRATMGGD